MLGCAPTIQSRLCSEAPAPHHRITFLEEDVTMLSDRCEHCAKQLVAVHATYLRNSEYSATAPQISATPTPTHPSAQSDALRRDGIVNHDRHAQHRREGQQQAQCSCLPTRD